MTRRSGQVWSWKRMDKYKFLEHFKSRPQMVVRWLFAKTLLWPHMQIFLQKGAEIQATPNFLQISKLFSILIFWCRSILRIIFADFDLRANISAGRHHWRKQKKHIFFKKITFNVKCIFSVNIIDKIKQKWKVDPEIGCLCQRKFFFIFFLVAREKKGMRTFTDSIPIWSRSVKKWCDHQKKINPLTMNTFLFPRNEHRPKCESSNIPI